MAARRLIAVLVVLLVVSSIAAALAPEARRQPTTTNTEPTATNSQPGPDSAEPQPPKVPQADELPSGTLIERTISVELGTGLDKHGSGPGKQGGPAKAAAPPSVEADVGDRIALQVDSEETVGIEIPDFGLLETATAGAPARFDLLLREAGSYPVRITGGETVATIVVTEPDAAGGKPEAKGSGKGQSDAGDPATGSGAGQPGSAPQPGTSPKPVETTAA